MKKIKKYSNIEMDDFRRYRDGDMTGDERNSFERKLQKDWFSEEAMEGFDSISQGEMEEDLSELRIRLHRRLKRKGISMIYRIAASVAVLMIISSVFFVVQRKQPESASEYPVVIFDIARAEPVYNPDVPEKKQVNPPGEPAGSSERTREAKDADDSDLMISAIPEEQIIEERQEQKQEEFIALEEVQTENEKRAAEAEDRASGGVAAAQPAAALRSKYRSEIPGDTPPLPEDGMDAFNKYIREKTNLTRGGQIEIETAFIVKTNGIIDSIRVLRNPPKNYADEAVRLIRSGPAWKPAIRNGRVVDEEVRLRIELSAR